MHPVERKSQSAPARLITRYRKQLPYINFYRFCQLLEQSQPDQPPIGSGWQARQEAVRFCPYPGMGFPASEIKDAVIPEESHLPPTVHVTFMGLYGVTSPLPAHYISDIAQQREGHEAAADFLDIFSHRLITQYYRIWRKYSYPATFEAGGQDKTSQYLLGLARLGIPGCAQNIATPVSRFLALLPLMLLPRRTTEGLTSLVTLLAPGTQARVWHHDRRRIPLKTPLAMRVHHPVSLKSRPVMGDHATDVNGQVLLQLSTQTGSEVQGWLPGGQLYSDLLALLHVYLGSRLDVRLQLCVERSLLPDVRLSCRPAAGSPQLGRTAVMRTQAKITTSAARVMTIRLGRYQRVQEHYQRKEAQENGDYRW
ncbi:type VI secretion system baseplate subunit TssG [Escherichia coli]|nr:type VI secretion system baseplate subunit TssG [Escherichia coli]HAU9066808.1 type VI secretion system baseplate subunit TssG [Escherichia coli]